MWQQESIMLCAFIKRNAMVMDDLLGEVQAQQ
jgi:hypothetical protein